MLNHQPAGIASPAENPQSQLSRLIVRENDTAAVSARELHRYVESSERFSKWIDRMFEYGFAHGTDYTPYQKVHPLNKQSFQDFALTLDTAKEIAMIQRNEKGRQARLYFIECEKKLRALAQAPQTALIQLINELTKKVINLESKIDRIHKARVTYFRARVINHAQQQQQKRQSEVKLKRDKAMALISDYIGRWGFYSRTWDEVWSLLESEYRVNIKQCRQGQGEHLIDVAARCGHINAVYEIICSKYSRN